MDVLERDRQWLSDEFKSSFMLAIALHIFIIMLAFILGRVLGVIGGPAEDAPLEIISASVRVDVVGMPKFTIEELRQMELPSDAPKDEPSQAEASKEQVTEAPAKPDDIVMPEEGKEKPKKSLTSFLQDYSKKEVKVAPNNKKGEKKGKIDGLDSLIIEGNRLSKGTALVGSTSDLADSAYVGYGQTIPERVRLQWRLPGYLKEQTQLKCRVQLWIGPRGELLKAQVRESSGNSEYDDLALGAVRASAPFPPPPIDAAPKIASRGLVLGFPL